MKKALLFFLLFLLFLLYYQNIFASETFDKSKNDGYYGDIIEDILCKRSKLWNELFLQGRDLEGILLDLDEIVCEPLLEYDIKAFTDIKENYTNMDTIKGVTINRIKNIKNNKDLLELDVEVEWHMENLSGEYREIIEYHMILKDFQGKWKISDYFVK